MDFNHGREKILSFIINKYPNLKESLQESEGLNSKIQNFLRTLKRYWKESDYNFSKFLNKRETWLAHQLTIYDLNKPSTSGLPHGRPKKSFDNSSRTSRKRKISDVVESHSLEELVFATESKLRKCGNRDAANMLKELILSPKRGTKVKQIYRRSLFQERPGIFSPEEALSLIVSCQLTTFQYSFIRKTAADKKSKLYPSYYTILKAKQACYPSEISVHDDSAEVKLQSLVDVTIKRFFKIQNEQLFSFVAKNNVKELQYVVKWGCDGCGFLPRYKQRGSDLSVVDDSSVLATSFVPLQLCTINDEDERRHILWQNPRSSSPRFCRPIRFRFVKETTEEIVKEVEHIEKQISQLAPVEVDVGGRIIKIIPKFLLTMIDGKVCNALASNACTQKCYICGATSKTMNQLEKRQVIEENLSWGLSTLHAYIRFMECILHISYRLQVPKWMARLSNEEKEVIQKKKEKVIRDFRTETGLLIDTPKPGGGNTNDGNTARRFFADPVTSSRLTGVDQKLIERFGVILKTLACGQPINVHAFDKFAFDTAQLYVSQYSWYPMPVTVHKVLIHGSIIIGKYIIPIGQLSEDVVEIQHKQFKKARENRSRKMSRVQTNTDVIHHLLVSSDPLITSLRHLPPIKHHQSLDKAVKALLSDEREVVTSSSESSDDDLGVCKMKI